MLTLLSLYYENDANGRSVCCGLQLRSQAETELRVMKAELTQKKIHVTLSRMQQGHMMSSNSTALAIPPY